MSGPSPYEPPQPSPLPPGQRRAAPPPLGPNPTDLEHLRWLSIGHYVLSLLLVLAGCCGVFYLGLGVTAMVNPALLDEPEGAESTFMGGMFAVLGVAFMLFAWCMSVALYLTGRWLTAHRRWMFCVVVSCVIMLFQPLGTILGIFTLIVLLRPSVKVLFQGMPPTAVTATGIGDNPFGR
ncbi:MAG: hypothetical protein K2Y37_03985 [Pirellulales bacterium]|nr:hypothetical protein [Pirellulales bacterium]